MSSSEESSWGPRLALGAVVIAGVVFFFTLPEQEEGLPPSQWVILCAGWYQMLLDQMKLAVKGHAPETHVFGGALRVVRKGSEVSVVAEGVPQKPCVNSSWKLSSNGKIEINGVAPQRVTASGLAELCALAEGDATIIWTPKKK